MFPLTNLGLALLLSLHSPRLPPPAYRPPLLRDPRPGSGLPPPPSSALLGLAEDEDIPSDLTMHHLAFLLLAPVESL